MIFLMIKKSPRISVFFLTENTLSYDCPYGQVISLDWLRQVMSDCVALRRERGQSYHNVCILAKPKANL